MLLYVLGAFLPSDPSLAGAVTRIPESKRSRLARVGSGEAPGSKSEYDNARKIVSLTGIGVTRIYVHKNLGSARVRVPAARRRPAGGAGTAASVKRRQCVLL